MNPYVAAWTGIAIAGAVLSAILLAESVLDLRALGHDIRNGRRWHVRGRIASEAIRLVVHSAFAIVGLFVLGAPTRPPNPVILVLIGGLFLLIVNSVIAYYIRRVTERRLTTAEIEAEAILVAEQLRVTAEAAAARLLDLAELTALAMPASDVARAADAAEATAIHAERIAENTTPATADEEAGS